MSGTIELTQIQESRTIHMIPVSDLLDHEENESIYGPMGEPDPELVESIRERGVLQPLIVTGYGNWKSPELVIIACAADTLCVCSMMHMWE